MQEITIKRPGTAAAATSVKSSAFLLPDEPAASVQQTVESAAKIPSPLLIPEEPETPSALLVPEEPETTKPSTATKTRKTFTRTFGSHMTVYASKQLTDALREDTGDEQHKKPTNKTRNLFIRTFGCQMNEYVSDKMADVLREDQCVELTQNPDEADIILFNTCSVREKAQEKVFSDLGRVQHLKQSNPDLIIGVGGCVASQEGDAIIKRASYVDVAFGPQTLHQIGRAHV